MYDPALGRWFVIDNKAEKFYSFTPYTYGANNPVRFIDPDGNVIVDATGKKITYSAKTGWSPNATADVKRIYASMHKTDAGRAGWDRMQSSHRKIALNINSDIQPANSKTLGVTSVGYVRDNNTGKLKLAEGSINKVTIFEENIRSTLYSGRQNEGLTLDEAIGVTATHESIHSADEDNLKAQETYVNNPTEANEAAVEDPAYAEGDKAREESKLNHKLKTISFFNKKVSTALRPM